MSRVHVVGAALLKDDPPRVLACRRTGPPALAGYWEFPGGKVEDGEGDEQALLRELREELGCEAEIGPRLGPDLPIGETAVLRVYLARLTSGEPQLRDHDAHRWLTEDELDDVAWIPVDAPLLPSLRAQLRGSNLAGPNGGASNLGPG
jgi:8-oxo-dGTP diphosphatase